MNAPDKSRYLKETQVDSWNVRPGFDRYLSTKHLHSPQLVGHVGYVAYEHNTRLIRFLGSRNARDDGL